MKAEAKQEFVQVGDFKVVVFLIAHDDKSAAFFNVTSECGNIRRADVRGRRVRANGLVARIGDEHHVDAGKGLRIERLAVNAHVELGAQARENLLVRAVRLVTRFADGVEIAAVEEDGLFLRERIGSG